MLRYVITIGNRVITDTKEADADLISLRYETDAKVDGQHLDMVIANINNHYTGEWMINDEVRVTLINEGYTAREGAAEPVVLFRHEYPLCHGFVENVDYGLFEVKLQAGCTEDDLAADHLKKDFEHDGKRISEILRWLLNDHDQAYAPLFDYWDIRIGSDENGGSRDLVLDDWRVQAKRSYREEIDFLAKKCGCVWWADTDVEGNRVFHFIDANALVQGNIHDLDNHITLPSLAFNAVGYCNDIVVLGGGNPYFGPGEPGAEIQTTKVVRGKREQIRENERHYGAPTFYDPRLRTEGQCEERAAATLAQFRRTNYNVAKPVTIGIAPILMSYVSYHVGDVLVQGKVTKKTVEFSADGWICYLEVNKFDESFAGKNVRPDEITPSGTAGTRIFAPVGSDPTAWTEPLGNRTIYNANPLEFFRLLSKADPSLGYEDVGPTGQYDLYYDQQSDRARVVNRSGDPPDDMWLVQPWESDKYPVGVRGGWPDW